MYGSASKNSNNMTLTYVYTSSLSKQQGAY